MWYLQAVMSAVTAAIGYALGLLVGWLARSLIPWRPGCKLRRNMRLSLAVAAIVLIPLFGVLGARWQHDIRELVEATQPNEANYILVVVVTALLTLACSWPRAGSAGWCGGSPGWSAGSYPTARRRPPWCW